MRLRICGWATWAAVGAALWLFAGCSSGHAGTDPASTGAGPPGDAVTARAINLTSRDMPGWRTGPDRTTSSDRAMQARLRSCAGGPDRAAVDVVELGSPTFTSGTSEVSSDVRIVRTPADAGNDLAAMAGPGLPGCIQEVAVPYLRSRLAAGASLGDVVVTRLTGPPGVPVSFGYRLVVPVSASGQGTVVITSDTIGCAAGRAEVEVNDTNSGGAPDAALDQRLAALVCERAVQRSRPS